MLEPDQWDRVLGSITGTIVHGTERVSFSRLLALLEVGPDPVTPSCEKLSWQSDGREVFSIR